MKPQLNDIDAERMLEPEEYLWSYWHKAFVRARRKGQSSSDYRKNEPDSISIEELDDNGLTVFGCFTQGPQQGPRLAWRENQTGPLKSRSSSADRPDRPGRVT